MIRDTIVSVAKSYAGLTAADPADRQRFSDLLAWCRDWRAALSVPFQCHQEGGHWITKGVSTCGLVAVGFWRAAGVDWPWLTQPYADGTVITGLQQQARARGLWHEYGPGQERPGIEPGDIVLTADDTESSISVHVFTCVGWELPCTLVSVDGGQVAPSGLQAIRERRRPWQVDARNIPHVDCGGGVVRRIWGWASPEG